MQQTVRRDESVKDISGDSKKIHSGMLLSWQKYNVTAARLVNDVYCYCVFFPSVAKSLLASFNVMLLCLPALCACGAFLVI